MGPMEWVDDGVVDDGEETVKPKGLALVLDETARSTLGVLIVVGSGDGHSKHGAGADTGAVGGEGGRGRGREDGVGKGR